MKIKKGKCWCFKPIAKRFSFFKPKLEELNKANSSKERVKIIKKSNLCFVRFLCEIGKNILKGNIRLPTAQFQKLKPHKRLLLYISGRQTPLRERKRVLLEKGGGFLPIVLPFLLSAISGFAGQALSKVLV